MRRLQCNTDCGKHGAVAILAEVVATLSIRFAESVIARLRMAGFSADEKKLFGQYYEKAQAAGDGDRLVQLVDLMLHMLIKVGLAKLKWVHP